MTLTSPGIVTRWLGYAPTDDTWESVRVLSNAMDDINAYNILYPIPLSEPPLEVTDTSELDSPLFLLLPSAAPSGAPLDPFLPLPKRPPTTPSPSVKNAPPILLLNKLVRRLVVPPAATGHRCQHPSRSSCGPAPCSPPRRRGPRCPAPSGASKPSSCRRRQPKRPATPWCSEASPATSSTDLCLSAVEEHAPGAT